MMSFSKGLPFHLLRCYIAILIFIGECQVGGVRIHTEIQAEGQNTLGLRSKKTARLELAASAACFHGDTNTSKTWRCGDKEKVENIGLLLSQTMPHARY